MDRFHYSLAEHTRQHLSGDPQRPEQVAAPPPAPQLRPAKRCLRDLLEPEKQLIADGIGLETFPRVSL